MPNRQKQRRRRRRRKHRRYRHTRRVKNVMPIEKVPIERLGVFADQRFGGLKVRYHSECPGHPEVAYIDPDDYGLYPSVTKLHLALSGWIHAGREIRGIADENAFVGALYKVYKELAKLSMSKIEIEWGGLSNRFQRWFRRLCIVDGIVDGGLGTLFHRHILSLYTGVRICANRECGNDDRERFGKGAKKKKGKNSGCEGGGLCRGCVLVDTFYCSRQCQKYDWNKGWHICT